MRTYQIFRELITAKDLQGSGTLLSYSATPNNGIRLVVYEQDHGFYSPLIIGEDIENFAGVVFARDGNAYGLTENSEMFMLFKNGEFLQNFPVNQDWEIIID